MAELKACPFCGGEAEVTREDEDHRWTVDCQQWLIDRKDPEDDCKVGIGYYDTKEEAIAAWNRRTPDALAQQLATALVLAGEIAFCEDCDHVSNEGTPCSKQCIEAEVASRTALAAAKEAGLLP